MIQSNSGKRVGFIALLSMALLGASPWVFAETCGIPGFAACCNTVSSNAVGICLAPSNTKYEFTLNRFGLELDDGTIEYSGSLTTFNAASVTVGQDMGNFISSASIALGATIVAVRPEVSQTFTVNGSGQSEHTTTAPAVNCSSGGDQTQTLTKDETDTDIPSCSTSPSAAQCLTSDGFIRMRETSLGTFTVGTAPITIQFDFDVGSGLVFTTGGGACTFRSMGPLGVTMTKQ